MENSITINGVKHVLVQVTDKSTFYCLTCSLYHKCQISRCPCHLFGAGIWWHFEIKE